MSNYDQQFAEAMTLNLCLNWEALKGSEASAQPSEQFAPKDEFWNDLID